MSDRISEMKQSENGQNMGRASSLVMAAVFIIVGGLLLLRNVTGISFDNWWVVFMLIPLSGIAARAWAEYLATGRISSGAIVTGGSMLLMMAIFLFDLNMGALWPVGLVLVGLAMLFGRR